MIGDVSDKGVAAALFMSMTKTLIKIVAQEKFAPSQILSRVNRQICEENDSAMFITIFLGILDLDSGEVVFVNAGHNPPLVCSRAEARFLKSTPNSAVGLKDNAAFKEDRLQLAAGQMLFMYTDGITEASNEKEGQFGEWRLKQELASKQDEAVGAAAKRILSRVKSFSPGAHQSDDITVLALRYL